MDNRLVQRRPLLPSCLLLLVAEHQGHGYELTERLKQWGFELAGPGPVYRELRILEEAGLVRSAWSAPQSGPVPRVYELTDEGRAALEQVSNDLGALQELLDEYQRRFKELAPPARAKLARKRRLL